MKKFKNFWKYFTLTVLLLLGLVCAGALYLFFVPHSSIFGLTYISYKEDVYSESYDLGENSIYKTLSTIKLTSNRIEVNIKEAASSAITLKVHNRCFGYTVKKHSKLNLSQLVEESGTILSFEVTEPVGAVGAGSSYIELLVPKATNLNLVLINNRAETNFKAENVSINNLNYQTHAGNLKLVSGKIVGELNLSLGRSKFQIENTFETSNNVVNLSLTSGAFNCKNKDFKTINLNSSTSGQIQANKCEEIKGNNSNAGGSINIVEVVSADIAAGDTNITIKILQSGSIRLSKSGKVNIETINGDADIYVNSGSITVNEAKAYLTCYSTSGKISVANAYGTVNVHTSSGDVNVTFNKDAEHFVPNIENVANPRKLIAIVETGNLTTSGVENVDIQVTSKGKIRVYMQDVIGSNRIEGNTGSVYVEIKLDLEKPETWPKYVLTTHSNTGNVSVNLATTLEQGTGGYTDKDRTELINGGSDVNNLNISTSSGSLTVRNDLTARF